MTTLPLHPAFTLPRGDSRRWSRLALAAIALGGLALTLLTHRYYGTFIRGADAQMYYAQVRSLVVDGDLAYENEITQLSPNRAVFYDQAGQLRVVRAADGRLVNKYTFGWALLTLPPFAVVHALQSITGGDTSGYSTAYDLAVALWHLLLVVAACAILMRAAAMLTDDRSAAVAVAAAFFATNLAYYTSVYPTMAHAASFAVVAIAVSLALRVYESPEDFAAWTASGLFAGLMVLLRPTDAVLLLALAPAAGRAMKSGRRRNWLLPALVAVGVVVAAVVQLCIWRISYGSWVVNSYGDNGEGFNWLSPALPAILTSTNHGAWYFHPFLLLGFLGIIFGACSRDRSRRSLWLAMLLACVAHIYVHACWHDWSFSHSFGHRVFANSSPIVALGAAVLVHRLHGLRRAAVAATFVVLIAWNVLLTVTFIKGGFPPVGEVSPGELIGAQLHTLSGR
jgi:hypothetical protein